MLRTPSAKLGALLAEIKRLGAGAENESISSEDVSAEYIDLEARVSNQRRLEAQLLTLLGGASTLEGALKVHQEIAKVRTEIDQAEGRRRFLATEVELAKVSLTLNQVQPKVSIALVELGGSLTDAAKDGVQVAFGIVTGAIRVGGVALPLILLLGLPGFITWRLVRRRRGKGTQALEA